ncbi:ABC transporter permease [Corynebacterium ulcerans]|uniref:Binding-protein-dependent integral membrane transport protein n=1 Tax=Corynebacterium ulcerans TaxID=65058 RepID=A0ABD7MS85_CORUL|nr:ABC transporter permease [Corynebacterium ulcerans]QQU25658.1 ABC transporter permease [Corynebacterium ulcerans]SNV01377.1 binding-protein-dependent integral membrane transport protein [Corynebacterium ulcerans]SQG50828.1 binding-protein-dependent integral membrane transport protein [Corynebacterium ulcerans]SQH02078.1 binding-protein-dependent integral membrane transport protein [Corynebacterium ulcerans]
MHRNRSAYFYALVFIALLIVNFALPRFMPGSPLKHVAGDAVGELTAADRMNLLTAYGLDKPLWQQFFLYIRDFFTLNWGTSFAKKESITAILLRAAPWTLLLASANLILSTFIGAWLGRRSALKRGEGKDRRYVVGAALMSSIPIFWVCIVLLSLFAATWRLFPLGGAVDLWHKHSGIAWVVDVAHHLTLPLLAMVFGTITTYFIAMRQGTLRVINNSYVELARLRNISEDRVRRWYITRNALTQVFTIFMIDVGYLFSGSLVVESVFSYPGLGQVMTEAVFNRDYPLIQSSFLAISLLVLASSYLSDRLYSRVNIGAEI